jgi:RND family efflux transporter MFP subunit
MKTLRAALLLAAAGCGKAAAAPPPPAGPAAVPSVAVVRVASEKLRKPIRAVGELQAYRNVAIYAKVPGFVDWIGVDRGSEVYAGEPLVRLLAPELTSHRNEAEARLASSEATYRRLKEASATPGVVAAHELEIAQKNVEADRARLVTCEQQELYLRIVAPFEGRVTERNVHEGSIVGPASGAPMLRLQQVHRLRLVAAVPETAAGEVTDGERVSFAVPAYPGESFSGAVARNARALDPRTRTMPVELDVDNASGRLAPGMFAEVRWPMKRAAPSLFVPASAVAVTTERTFVVRIKGDVAEWVDVKTGVSLGDRVEVFGGLAEGDPVAARGTDEIKAGSKVLPKEAPAAK